VPLSQNPSHRRLDVHLGTESDLNKLIEINLNVVAGLTSVSPPVPLGGITSPLRIE
jgi:hypothetical protein